MSGDSRFQTHIREGEEKNIGNILISNGENLSNPILSIGKTLVQLAVPTGILGDKLQILTESSPGSGVFEIATNVLGNDLAIKIPGSLPKHIQVYFPDFLGSQSFKLRSVDNSGTPVNQSQDITIKPTLRAA